MSITVVEASHRLPDADTAEVLALLRAARRADGLSPVSEHVWLHLRHGGDADAQHLLLRDDDGTLVGYAHLDVTDAVAGPSAELVVHPAHRGRGHGGRLLDAVHRRATDTGGQLRLWSHGVHPTSKALAARRGFTRVRSLWQLRRSLLAPIPAVPTPAGVRLRTFRPGEDDNPWLRLNARAFANHPEQGGWTLDDLHRRMRERWFDPAGFFLAERTDGSGRLLGFHWTKVHGERRPSDGAQAPTPHHHGHPPIGEVYVLGVDPDATGRGLARALTVRGLDHLRDLDLPEVLLYVEESNTAAIALYRSLGFTHWDTDVMYALPGPGTPTLQPGDAEAPAVAPVTTERGTMGE